MNNGETVSRPWLEYSEESDKGFAFVENVGEKSLFRSGRT